MLQSGDWVLPFRYGSEFATKPPLLHWLMAFCASALGFFSPGIARLPSLCSSAAVIILMYRCLTRYFYREFAALSCILLATSFLWLRSSFLTRVDMLFSAAIVIACLALFEFHRGAFLKSKMMIFATLALTAATLTKGPAAFVLVCTPYAPFLFLKKVHWRVICNQLVFLVLPALFVSSLWYLAAFLEGGTAFASVVANENFGRFMGTMQAGRQPHQHSCYYLWSTLFFGLLPTLFLFLFVPWKQILLDCKNFFSSDFRQNCYNQIPDWIVFSLTFTFVCLLFFAFPASKRAVYLLPAYPFLATIVAQILLRYENVIRSRVCTCLQKCSLQYFRDGNAVHTFGLSANRLLGLFLALHLVLGLAGFFVTSGISGKHVAQEIASYVQPEETLYSFNKYYLLNFYLRRRMQQFNSVTSIPASVVVEFTDKQAFLTTLPEDQHAELIFQSTAGVIKSSRKMLLFRVTDS